jgi:hypothetical protein
MVGKVNETPNGLRDLSTIPGQLGKSGKKQGPGTYAGSRVLRKASDLLLVPHTGTGGRSQGLSVDL